MFLARNGYRIFLHRFKERRLGFGRGTVDFIGQNNIGKYGPSDKTEIAFIVQSFRTQNIRRHQVRRELDTIKTQIQGPRNGLNQEGFC